jgi:hypothetical protein
VLSAVLQELSQVDTDGAMFGLTDRTVSQLAHYLGVSEMKAEAIAVRTSIALGEQAGAALRHAGVTEDQAEAREAWVKAHRPQEFRRAQMNQLFSGDLSGFRALAQEFLRQHAPRREAQFRTAQYAPELKHRVVGGTAVVISPGVGEISVKMAEKLSFLRIGR